MKELFTLYYHRRILFTDFFSQSQKYFPTYIPRYYDELYQECMVALYDAIPKFNPERATLSTYLTKPLHRAMSAYIHSLTNRSNSYYGKQMDDVRHAIHVLETEGKRTTESNIALYTNYSLRQVHDILFRLTYIDEEIGRASCRERV